MTKWQYAWLTDQPQTTLGFSHPQPGLAGELTTILGPTVLTAQSNDWSIAFDRTRANLGYVSGLMGDRGWEMFAVVSHPGPMGMPQTNWYFKRPAAEMAAPLTTPAPVAPAAPPAPPAPMAPPEPPAGS